MKPVLHVTASRWIQRKLCWKDGRAILHDSTSSSFDHFWASSFILHGDSASSLTMNGMKLRCSWSHSCSLALCIEYGERKSTSPNSQTKQWKVYGGKHGNPWKSLKIHKPPPSLGFHHVQPPIGTWIYHRFEPPPAWSYTIMARTSARYSYSYIRLPKKPVGITPGKLT